VTYLAVGSHLALRDKFYNLEVTPCENHQSCLSGRTGRSPLPTLPGVLAGLLFGYGFFVLGVLVIGVSPDVAYQTCGIITSGVSVVVWKFLWSEFYGPTAGERDA